MGAKRIDLTGQVFDDLTVEEFDHNSNKLNYWKCRCICGNIKICSVNKLNQHIGTKCKCHSLSKKDLTGQKFGELTAIKPIRINKIPHWECLCSCGNIKLVNAYYLQKGVIQHCGDYIKHPKLDLAGQKFNMLTVLHINGNNKNNIIWACQCDCGELTMATTYGLTSGIRKSCGCISKKTNKDRHQPHKRQNNYNLSNSYGIGWTSNTNKEFYFDLEDYDKIKSYLWRENSRGYIETSIYSKIKHKTSTILIHRLILGLTNPNIVVDHIHHNKRDNRKTEIRPITQADNTKNHITQKNSPFGVTGVRFDKIKQKYYASISINNKHIHLGFFDQIENAIIARQNAEKELYGEYAYVK